MTGTGRPVWSSVRRQRLCLRPAQQEGVVSGCGAPRVGHARVASVQRPRRAPGCRRRRVMAAELHRRKEQLKQRLSRHLSTSQENSLNIPPVVELRNVLKTGALLKLSSRGRLYPRCWKKRLCVLTKTTLYIYKTEGNVGTEKPVGSIDLSIFSNCKEMGQKDAKKTANTFILYRSDAVEQEVVRHVFAAPSPAELKDWLRKLRPGDRPLVGRQEWERRAEPPPPPPAAVPEVAGGRSTIGRPEGTSVDPAMVPLPAEGAAGGGRRPRGRARQRPRPAAGRPGGPMAIQPAQLTAASSSSSSQPCLLAWPGRSGGTRMTGGSGLSSAYEYSSSGESVSSLSSSRCSVVQRLNTTMPEITLPRRSASPPAPAAATSASDVCQQRAAGSVGFPIVTKAMCRERPKRGSLPSIVAPLEDLEADFGQLSVGGATASTGSSSPTNLTVTLTREGQTVPAVLAGLAELKDGLRQASCRVDSVEAALGNCDADMATTRADIATVQGTLASLQSLATSLNNKMTMFSGMFRKVDEQLQEMWAEMETVNNNVHHVMHTALESQERNEQLFVQLSSLRSQLLTSFPDQLTCGGSLPRATRLRHGGSRHRRDRLDSEQLCEIDDPAAMEELPVPTSVTGEQVAPPAEDVPVPETPPTAASDGEEEPGSGRVTPLGGGLPP